MIIFSHLRITYHILIFTGLISLLTTCSSTRFIYTFVDEFIKDEITYFLKLDEDEKVLLNKQVSEMVNWHRTSMLPRYSDYLNNIANKLENDEYSANDISKLMANGRFLIEETVIGLVPYASKFLINHQTSESIDYMEKRMLNRRQERIIELSKSEDILLKAGENDMGGLKEWSTDMPIDADFVLDENAQKIADEAAKSSTCIPIGEGENCW